MGGKRSDRGKLKSVEEGQPGSTEPHTAPEAGEGKRQPAPTSAASAAPKAAAKSPAITDSRFTLDSDFEDDEPGVAAWNATKEAGAAVHGEQAGNSGDAVEEAAARSDGGEEDEKNQGKLKKVLSEAKIKKMKEKYERRGIIYVSRIPPNMKPAKLRHLLAAHGEIGRVYCTPEDPAARLARKRRGGNTGKLFTEGWVEFEDKKVAKQVAQMLNGQPIGGKKRSAYYYDLWAIKYLPKFKWDDLTADIAYERAVREQKLAAEVSQAKRERDFYLSRVDKAKAVEAITERKRKRADVEASASSVEAQPAAAPAAGSKGDATNDAAAAAIKRMYGQRKAKPDPVTSAEAPQLGDDVLSLLARKRQKSGV